MAPNRLRVLVIFILWVDRNGFNNITNDSRNLQTRYMIINMLILKGQKKAQGLLYFHIRQPLQYDACS